MKLSVLTMIVLMFVSGCSMKNAKRDCHLPDPTWRKWGFQREGLELHYKGINIITLQHGGLVKWNENSITRAKLSEYLATISQWSSKPVTVFRPSADAACGDVESIRSEMTRVLICTKEKICAEGADWHAVRQSGANI